MSIKSARNYSAPLYKRKSLRFECTQCGICCTGGDDYYVSVSHQEAESIRQYLGLSRSWFKRRYLQKIPELGLAIRSTADEKCIFLTAEGHCKIYPVRPIQCKTYPFWPEVVGSTKGWQREARRCEGMDHGPIVPIRKIESALSMLKISS